MAQKMYWREDNSKKFVNPYNFVRLGNGVQRGKSVKGNLSGKISCEIVTKTPLSLPDETTAVTQKVRDSNGREQEHKYKKFLSVGGRPLIPGSEIRGVIRSAYETLSDSCLSVNNDNVLSTRHPTPRTPGIIQYVQGEWKLYEAKSSPVKYPTDVYEDNNTVLRTWKISVAAQKKLRGQKTRTFIFRKKGREVKVNNLESALADYFQCMNIYCENDSFFDNYKGTVRKDGKPHPIFYEMVSDERGNEYVYLSPAQISRSVYKSTISKALGTYSKCVNSENVCEACALFGMIGEKGKGAVSSKVRFTDGFLEEEPESVILKKKTLKELAGPKKSSVEFYSERPERALFWTFDYAGYGYKTITDEDGKGKTVPVRTVIPIKLRGRKYYFHSKGKYETSEKTCRNITTDLINEGAHFKFDVYYDGITETALENLIRTLTLGENTPEGSHMHKIGHGKPLGLGSIKITVNEISVRSYGEETYKIETVSADEMLKVNNFDDNAGYYKDFMLITDFNYVIKENVVYPVADDCLDKPNSKASHQWFIGNRQLGEGGRGTKVSIKYTLPHLGDKVLSLPSLVKDKTEAYGGYGNNRGNNGYSGGNNGYRGGNNYGYRGNNNGYRNGKKGGGFSF